MGLEQIKVGDRVWISAQWGGGDKGEIKTVVRLTPTQIILDGIEKYNRYQRGKPSRYGDHEPQYYAIGRGGGRITLIATQSECEAWDVEKERKRLEAEDYKARQAAAKSKREELTSLFPASSEDNRGTYVNDASFGGRDFRDGRFDVTFHGLTESEVRQLAEKIQRANTDASSGTTAQGGVEEFLSA